MNFYYVDIVDGRKKKKHKRNFRTKKDGEKFEREFREQHELKAGEMPKANGAKSITFAELVKEYRAVKSHTIREYTWKTKNDYYKLQNIAIFQENES